MTTAQILLYLLQHLLPLLYRLMELELKMNQIICLKHPYYDGHEQPLLTCHCCCKIFVDQLKKGREDRKLPLRVYNKKPMNPVSSLPTLKASNYCPTSL